MGHGSRTRAWPDGTRRDDRARVEASRAGAAQQRAGPAVSNVFPFRASQAAELVDADGNRFAGARARCALLGAVLHRQIGADGVTFAIGMHLFRTIDDLEDWLDQI